MQALASFSQYWRGLATPSQTHSLISSRLVARDGDANVHVLKELALEVISDGLVESHHPGGVLGIKPNLKDDGGHLSLRAL
jgi:hypothetical protein